MERPVLFARLVNCSPRLLLSLSLCSPCLLLSPPLAFGATRWTPPSAAHPYPTLLAQMVARAQGRKTIKGTVHGKQSIPFHVLPGLFRVLRVSLRCFWGVSGRVKIFWGDLDDFAGRWRNSQGGGEILRRAPTKRPPRAQKYSTD